MGKPGQPMPLHVRERIEAHLADHLASPLSLRRLAAIAGMYVPDFLDAFRAQFGINPAQYLLALRLERVCTLLTSTEMSVTAIARATGFKEGKNLHPTFKRRFGMTPMEFRYRNSV